MPNNDYANEPNQSRSEEIIQSILDNTEYDEAARSRIEYLLIELKNAIEGGGGGGGVTSYSPLTEKPKIDNHTLQAGNNTSSDLGLQTKLTFDSAPTESSTKPVTSGGVYTALGTKANSADVYNKSSVDTALTAKADKSTTYTKTEVDTALSSKQNTISDLSTIRSGAALGATAVQPVSGKGLSTNDYTTAEKEKLAGIEAQANKTTVDSALSESSTNPVQNKVVKSALDGKQAALSPEQLAAVNSGVTSTDVAQIGLNKNNILYNTENGVANIMPVQSSLTKSDSGLNYTIVGDKYILSGSRTIATSYYLVSDSIVLPSPNTDYTIYIDHQNNSTTTQLQIVARDGNTWVDIPGGTTTGLSTINSGNYERFMVRLLPDVTVGSAVNDTVRIMIIPKSLGVTSYQSYALSNAELTQEVIPLTKGIKLVAHTSNNGNTSLSYDTNINDFDIGSNTDKNSGVYLIVCNNWSTTPAPYIGLLTFSGATTNHFVKTDVVTGFAPTISIIENTANATIAISGAAKISIYAVR